MIALIQRTTNSSVTIDGKIYSEAGKGFLILLGVFVNDSEKQAEMLAFCLKYFAEKG